MATTAASIKQNCRKVVCIGRNYVDHISELNSARPSQPFFFLKPSTSIHPPSSGPCIRPRGIALSHEIELGLVIGKPPYNPKTKSAAYKNLPDTPTTAEIVSSYLLTIDMTARNAQWEAKKKGLPWSICKGFDTFLPISNVIPLSKIPDPANIEIWLSVNDKMRQDDSTNLMLFDIPRMLSDISKVFSLEEGDIVITGTPKGVGPVEAGDVMRAGIRVGGKEVDEAAMEVGCVDAEEEEGAYVYMET